MNTDPNLIAMANDMLGEDNHPFADMFRSKHKNHTKKRNKTSGVKRNNRRETSKRRKQARRR